MIHIVRVTTRDQRVTWVSDGAADAMGLAGHELVGRPIFELLDSVWTPALRALFSEADPGLESRADHIIVRVLSSDPTPACFELRMVHAVSAGPESVVAELTAIDTIRSDAQDAIDDERHLYRTLAQGSSDAVVIHDEQLILFANDSAAAMAGARDRHDLIGMQISAFLRAEDQASFDDVIRRAGRDGEAEVDVALQLLRLSGDVIRVVGSIVRVVWSGMNAFQVVLHRADTIAESAVAVAQVDETERLVALRACHIMDSSGDPAFDALALLASQLLGAPMALVTFVDVDRQWFKARVGIELTETSRDQSFCAHALERPRAPFVVADTRRDSRFEDNAMVVEGPRVRSYAGVPILSRESLPIGTICVLDIVPRQFSDSQIRQLAVLAEQVAALTDLRRRSIELHELLDGESVPLTNGSIGVPHPTNVAASEVGRAMALLAGVEQIGPDPTVRPAHMRRFGALHIDVRNRSVRVAGESIEMTLKEFDLLVYLADHAGIVCDRVELLREVWHSQSSWQDPSTVTEHIYRLRSKLEDEPANPRLITTVRGIGYRIDLDAFVAGRGVEPGSEHLDESTLMASGGRAHRDAPLAVIVTDSSFRILSWNGAAQELYGWTEDEVLGRTMNSIVPIDEQFDMTAALADLTAIGHWQQPVRQRTRNGTEISVLASVRLLRNDDGDVTALVAVNRPLSEATDHQGSVDSAVGIVDGSDVLRALDRQEFVVYYEPIVWLADRHLVAVRTRPRWLRPDGTIWDLNTFRGALERADVLDELLTFVCSTAVTQIERWTDAGRAIELAIELRGTQLDHAPLIDALCAASERLVRCGTRLWLEIEQRDVIAITTAGVAAALEQFDLSGGLVSIHGFGLDGIGVTTSEGRPMRIAALKVDASLIVGLEDVRISEFVQSIIALGRSVDVPIGVGGVVDEFQHSALVGVGCVVGQGPLYGEATLGDHLFDHR